MSKHLKFSLSSFCKTGSMKSSRHVIGDKCWNIYIKKHIKVLSGEEGIDSE
jgi:hypothetical protein